MVEQNWASDRGYDVGDRVPRGRPDGPHRAADRRDLQAHEQPQRRRARAMRRCRCRGRAAAVRPAPRAGCRSRSWRRTAATSAALKRQVKQRARHGRATCRRPARSRTQISKQLAGLNIVLYFFSGVALFVGGFLILNSFNMTVLQRMRELGMLRTLGASRRMATQLRPRSRRSMLGIVGTVLGLGLGLLLASGLIALMRGMGVPVGTLHVSAGAGDHGRLHRDRRHPARRLLAGAPRRAHLAHPRGARRRRRCAAAAPKRRLAIGLALFVPGVWFGGSFWFGGESETGGLAAYGGILLTMAMFAGMAAAAPFIIMPVIRVLAVPFRRLPPDRRAARGRLAPLEPASHRGHRRRAHDRALRRRGQQLDVGELRRHHPGSDRQGLRARLHRPGPGLHARAGRRPGRAALRRRGRSRRCPEAGTVAPHAGRCSSTCPRVKSGSKLGLATGVDPLKQPKVDRTEFQGVSRSEAYAGHRRRAACCSASQLRQARAPRSAATPSTSSAPRRAATRNGRRRHRRGRSDGRDGDADVARRRCARCTATTRPPSSPWWRGVPAAPALESKIGAAPRPQLPEPRDAVHGRREEAGRRRDQPHVQHVQRDRRSSRSSSACSASINTLAMSVIERTREIGVLRALGATRWQIRRTMLDESLMITIAGALVGVLAAC